jgi:hypothetical protein
MNADLQFPNSNGVFIMFVHSLLNFRFHVGRKI